MNNFTVCKATKNNLPQIIELMREFAVFEHLEDTFTVTENDLYEAFFGGKSFAGCLVAFSDNEMVGFAIFFPVLKTFRGERSLYLEDLYISQTMRSKGLGLKLLKAVANYAKENGFQRMDWQALDWNAPAINFYKNIGAETDTGMIDFRLRGEAFEKLAS